MNEENLQLTIDFSLQDMTGSTIKLEDFRDKEHIILVLNRGMF